jgi:hypothetical protein
LKVNFKVAFTHGVWKTVDADLFADNGEVVVFTKDGQPVLTCVLANVLYFEPFVPEPVRQELTAAQGSLFGRR